MAEEDQSTTGCRRSASCDALRPAGIFLVDRLKFGKSVQSLSGEGGKLRAAGLIAMGLRWGPGK
jgi:hypothetical protein